MANLGDYDASSIIYGHFTTFRPSSGAAYTLGGTPALSVYKDDGTTQSTTGVTLVADFDGVTGLNSFKIDTSADGTFYAAGSNFSVVITTGTVDSISVVGAVVASFSLRKDSALKPTTAGRTLDVTATGEAGIDWANIGGPTTTVNLSGTTVKTATDVETDTADIQTKIGTPAGASVSADVAAVKGDTAAILLDTGTDGVVVAAGSKTGYSLTATTGLGNQTADITGSLSGSVGSVTGAVGSVTGNVGGNVVGSVGSLAAQAKADVNAEVDSALNTAIPGTPTAGSINDVLKDLDALLPGSGTLSTLTAANVNAEVVDALATDTYAEPGQADPPATTTLAVKVNYLYKAFRNKAEQTATEYRLYNDDGTTVGQKATVSDDSTTFTRGELGTGA